MTYIRPQPVYHAGRIASEDEREVVLSTCKGLHLSKGETALMLFYTHCFSGFRPSQQLIADRIGVSRGHVPKLRKTLIDKTLLIEKCAYNRMGEKRLLINWKAIYILRCLDPRMTTKKDFCCVPHDSNVDRTVYEYMYGTQDRSIGLLGSLTDPEFKLFKKKIRNRKNAPIIEWGIEDYEYEGGSWITCDEPLTIFEKLWNEFIPF